MGYTHFSGVDATLLKIAGTVVTSTAAELNALDGITASYSELNILDNATVTAGELNTLDNVVASVDYTIGAEQSGGTITINVQFNNAAGSPVGTIACLPMYLATSVTGADRVTSAPSGGVDNGTDGELIPLVANLAFLGISENDGDLDVVIVESGNNSYWLATVLPNGYLDVSAEINFD